MNEEQTTQPAPASVRTSQLNRRTLLGGLASSLAALVAAACGRDTATPTPVPTACPTATGTPVAQSSLLTPPLPPPDITRFGNRLYMPWIAHEPTTVEVAVAPTLPPPPTEPPPTSTPKPPKPTKTPRPTNTPVPPATPFPSGPPSKLGFVVARHSEQLFELLATGGVAVVSTLELDANFIQRIKQVSPSTLLIGRLSSLDQVDLSTLEPLSAAQDFVNQLLPFAADEARAPYFDGWQAYNEPVVESPDHMKRLAEFEAERTRLLGERGIRSVIGNFATGAPPLELWEHFLPAVQAAQEHNGWLGLHEYSAPTVYFLSSRADQGRYPGVSPEDTGWLTLRYRKVYNEILKPAGLAIPLLFTEIGVDGYVKNGRPGPENGLGWQDFQQYWAENGFGLWGPGAYIEQLAWFDAAMRQDDYVQGGCIYVLAAGSPEWNSYDVQGPAASILQQYLSVHRRT